MKHRERITGIKILFLQFLEIIWSESLAVYKSRFIAKFGSYMSLPVFWDYLSLPLSLYVCLSQSLFLFVSVCLSLSVPVSLCLFRHDHSALKLHNASV